MNNTVWWKLKHFCSERKYTRHEVYAHMQRGQWPEGVIWRKAPNGRIYINPANHDNWVAGTLPAFGAHTQ